MAWDKTKPALNTAMVSTEIRNNFDYLDSLLGLSSSNPLAVNTDALVVTAAKCVGIGTIPDTARVLTIYNSASTMVGSVKSNGTGAFLGFSDTTTTNNTYVRFGALGNNAVIHAAGSEAMRLCATTRNVLINTPDDDGVNKLQVAGSAKVTTLFATGTTVENPAASTVLTFGGTAGTNNATITKFKVGSTQKGWLVGAQYNAAGFEITPSTAAGGDTYSTPALFITQASNVGIGTTNAAGRLTVQFDSSVTAPCQLRDTRTGSAAASIQGFYRNGALVGYISTTDVATAYNTSSDGRLKVDKGICEATEVLAATRVHDFEWKINGKTDRGVFAQEAVLVKPSAVMVGDDHPETITQQWGVDYSKYVPDLIVGWQAHEREIQRLGAEIDRLKGLVSAGPLQP